MEEFNFHNNSNYSDYWDNGRYNFTSTIGSYFPEGFELIVSVVICVGLPLTLLAIYFLFLQVRKGHVVSVYVINLLISDLIQMICLGILILQKSYTSFIISGIVYPTSLMASVGFMMCIAVERYLVMACPLWYRFKQSVKLSVIVSVIVWVLSIAELFIIMLLPHPFHLISWCIFLLLPLLILIFSLAGSLKALSSAIAVPPKEKCRIIGTLVLVLLIYTLLFLPVFIAVLHLLLYSDIRHMPEIYGVNPFLFILLSPLADLFLYVFMRRGAADRLLFCHCCCKTAEEEPSQNISTIQTSVDHVRSV